MTEDADMLDRKGLAAATQALQDSGAGGEATAKIAIRAYLSAVSPALPGVEAVARLVERLQIREDIERHGATISADEPIADLLADAASALAALSARVEELKRIIRRLQDSNSKIVADALNERLAAEAEKKRLREALMALEKAAKAYHAVTQEYFSDTEYDRNGMLAEADAELTVSAIPDALAALSPSQPGEEQP